MKQKCTKFYVLFSEASLGYEEPHLDSRKDDRKGEIREKKGNRKLSKDCVLKNRNAGAKVSRGPAPAPLNLASYGPCSCFVGPYIISHPNAISAYGGVSSIQKLSFRNFVGPRHLFQTTLTTAGMAEQSLEFYR
jgi:hypothetical protein